MPYRRAQFQAPGRLARSHAEHDLVVRAVLARDAAGANAAMLVHMSVVEDVVVDMTGASQREAPWPGDPPPGRRGAPRRTTARPMRALPETRATPRADEAGAFACVHT